jgi:hypothetical protein
MYLRHGLDSIALELHGNDDGTVPATFQVIYMVYYVPSSVSVYYLMSILYLDWMETSTHTTKTTGEGISKDKSQRGFVVVSFFFC